MKKIDFNVNDHYKLRCFTLIVGVIMGLIFGFITGSVIPMILLPVVSQYAWIIDWVKRITYKEDIQSLIKLTDSAVLYNPPDRYSKGRYGRAVNYHLEHFNQSGYYLLRIEANGIRNSTKLDSLAADISSAFGHPAYLVENSPGYIVYRIDLKRRAPQVHEDEF